MERRKVETRVQARRTESTPTSQLRHERTENERKEHETSKHRTDTKVHCDDADGEELLRERPWAGQCVVPEMVHGRLVQTQNVQHSHVDSRARHYRAERSVRCDAPNRMSAGERKHRSSNLESTRNMAPMPVGDKTSRSGPATFGRPNMESLNTAHRLPRSVLFTHPVRRFQPCVNGPPFSDDKASGGGVETERRTEMTIMLVSAGWGSRRGGVCEDPSGAGRGAQRGLTRTQGRPKRSPRQKGRNRRPAQAVSGRARGAVTGRV